MHKVGVHLGIGYPCMQCNKKSGFTVASQSEVYLCSRHTQEISSITLGHSDAQVNSYGCL